MQKLHGSIGKMTKQLTGSAKRVQDFLQSRGFAFTVRELPGSTRTAEDAAKSVGCPVSRIAKSLIFQDQKSLDFIVVIASGANRVDTKKIEAATGLRLGRVEGKLIKERIGFAIGGIPPVGHNAPLRTILDPDLQKYASIWAAAGTPSAVFELPTAALEKLTNGEWVTLAEEPGSSLG